MLEFNIWWCVRKRTRRRKRTHRRRATFDLFGLIPSLYFLWLYAVIFADHGQNCSCEDAQLTCAYRYGSCWHCARGQIPWYLRRAAFPKSNVKARNLPATAAASDFQVSLMHHTTDSFSQGRKAKQARPDRTSYDLGSLLGGYTRHFPGLRVVLFKKLAMNRLPGSSNVYICKSSASGSFLGQRINASI